MDLPTTVAEIDQLIADQVQESLHLDYKRSTAIDGSKRKEIAKDVSAFANSDGGILLYGLVEVNNLPQERDAGVDHNLYSREWLEQVISSNVSPRIDGVVILPIPSSADRSYYAVEVPKTSRGPHQCSDNKYYKRFNFQSVPMEDYEINDVRNRRVLVPPLIEVGVSIRHSVLVYLNITNIGDAAAQNVTFQFPDEVRSWAEKENAHALTTGIKYFPPKKFFKFRLGHAPQLLQGSDHSIRSFGMEVSYDHPTSGSRVTDTFHIDVMEFFGSYIEESEIYELGKEIKEAAKKLTDEMNKINSNLSRLAALAGPTGLDLSISSLRNLQHIASSDEHLEKINPMNLEYNAFVEILGVDVEMACSLSDFFYRDNATGGLNELAGMTDELIEKIDKYFIVQKSEEGIKNQ